MNISPPWWFKFAACRGRGHRAFVGARGGNVQVAKTICSTCPVAEVCLMYALALEDPSNRAGVYGGASGPDRDEMVKIHSITLEQAHEWYLVEQRRLMDRMRDLP